MTARFGRGNHEWLFSSFPRLIWNAKHKKTSTVFYEVYSDDAAWIVYKTQFKKDKQVKTSNRRFRRDGGYSCK